MTTIFWVQISTYFNTSTLFPSICTKQLRRFIDNMWHNITSRFALHNALDYTSNKCGIKISPHHSSFTKGKMIYEVFLGMLAFARNLCFKTEYQRSHSYGSGLEFVWGIRVVHWMHCPWHTIEKKVDLTEDRLESEASRLNVKFGSDQL